jgi:hypothetical protein
MSVDRDLQCPDRGPGLSHMQDKRALPDGECVFCGELVQKVPKMRYYPPNAERVKVDQTPPPLDVAARLEALGLIPPEREHTPEELVEPKMVGDTPYSPNWRNHAGDPGDLSEREKRRLEFYLYVVRMGKD